MKMLFYSSLFLILASCCSFKKSTSYNSSLEINSKYTFLVSSIVKNNDSIIIIYGIKNDSLFKLVSFNSNLSKCDSIKVGASYKFVVKSLLRPPASEKTIDQTGLEIMAQHIEGIMYHGNVIVFENDLGIFDIYEVVNLDGMRFKECNN